MKLRKSHRDHSRLGVGLRTLLLLANNFPTNYVFPYVIFLGEVEEASDFRSPLGTKTFGQNHIGQSRDLVLALLDDHDREDSDIGTDDATTDRLALALTSAAGAVAGVAVREKKADTVRDKDTLLHGETLLIVTTGDTEDISLPLVA